MKPSSLAYLCWGLAAVLWLTVQIASTAGVRINHTPSLPMGIWRIEPLREPLRPGQIVSFCPPDTAVMREARTRGYIGHGACPGGYEPMLKPVAAIGGDAVTVAEHGVTVNGELVANSRRLALDRQDFSSLSILHGADTSTTPAPGLTTLTTNRPTTSASVVTTSK